MTDNLVAEFFIRNPTGQFEKVEQTELTINCLVINLPPISQSITCAPIDLSRDVKGDLK